jgi:hypothetical protein
LDLISESGSKLKFRSHLMDLTSDDKRAMEFNPKHIPKPVVSDQRSDKFHLPLCLRFVYESNFVQVARPPTYALLSAFTGSYKVGWKSELWRRADPKPVAKRLRCSRMISPGQMSHAGPHTHGEENQSFQFCEAQWVTMTYFAWEDAQTI